MRGDGRCDSPPPPPTHTLPFLLYLDGRGAVGLLAVDDDLEALRLVQPVGHTQGFVVLLLGSHLEGGIGE